MSPVYTSDGDQGETGYLGKGRISKSSLRIESVGSVDEANAAIGLARALCADPKSKTILFEVQKHLYLLMTELSASPEMADQFDRLNQDHVNWLEEQIEDLESAVVLPREFIIPGSSPASGAIHLARTIVRRAERRAVSMLEAELIKKQLLIAYLNRLSSLLFMVEVYEALSAGNDIQLAKET
ncbi:MAG TPA: cob(I)yrinic acid a,c-diamide adenosyltransferase [Brevefilum sp.]|nr:cob(I)yrinic acid a,c-diamide adenosyltransferase [Brevefilum sp.]HOR19361.1 cob(I)yrinic acid a,c-diamide adenosyltransferase [Brevefilum sp.]HPL69772.1 cob(I)yrinic acid a,c-diamide adenosyltransferase [Brevefilum sp.]